MNLHSSRSHAILRMRIERRSKISETKIKTFESLVHLIDLAGSEDITRSNVTGLQLSEATNINCDLFHLHRVFEAIQNKSKHIPFRDSILTFVL